MWSAELIRTLAAGFVLLRISSTAKPAFQAGVRTHEDMDHEYRKDRFTHTAVSGCRDGRSSTRPP